jgi:hypothetical protein
MITFSRLVFIKPNITARYLHFDCGKNFTSAADPGLDG